MKAGELIEVLQDMDPDADVAIVVFEGGTEVSYWLEGDHEIDQDPEHGSILIKPVELQQR